MPCLLLPETDHDQDKVVERDPVAIGLMGPKMTELRWHRSSIGSR